MDNQLPRLGYRGRYPTWGIGHIDLNELNQTTQRTRRRSLSFSLRELLLLFVIASLALIYFVRPSLSSKASSNAPFSIDSPIEYRYWHQLGPNGSGTGQIGSGDEWKPAKGIEVFENFIILHLQGDVDRMIEREGLQWFDWRKVGSSSQNGNAVRAAPSSTH